MAPPSPAATHHVACALRAVGTAYLWLRRLTAVGQRGRHTRQGGMREGDVIAAGRCCDFKSTHVSWWTTPTKNMHNRVANFTHRTLPDVRTMRRRTSSACRLEDHLPQPNMLHLCVWVAHGVHGSVGERSHVGLPARVCGNAHVLGGYGKDLWYLREKDTRLAGCCCRQLGSMLLVDDWQYHHIPRDRYGAIW